MAIPGNMLSPATESMDPTYTGWRPRLNCSLLSATGGRNGAKTLAVRSGAAGEAQAETVTGYPVVAGQVYQVFADASSATEPERIGIEWLDATYTPVGSVLWSLTTSAASASWHRVGVAGMAPVGAVRARIVLSSTAGGAAVPHYWENVYLGPSVRTTGNLYSFGTESSEIDASGWKSEVNATISRQAPPVSWAVDWYWAGGQVLAATVIAAGNAAIASVERPAVTPGAEYLGYAYLAPPTTTSAAWIELRFYDAAGAQITATRSALAAATTGFQRQRVSAVAPAAAASARLAVGVDGATAGQVLRLEQAVIAVAPVLQAGSVLPYADASFEQGVAGWTTTAGVATLARSSPWGAYAYDGSYALTITSTTATASTIRSAKFQLPAGSGGLSFRLRYTATVTAGGWSSSRGIRWYDATGTDLGLTKFTDSGLPASGWWLLGTDQTSPAGATQAAVEWTFTATAANSVLRLDRVALWQALPVMTVEVREATASVTLTARELAVGALLRVTRVTSSGARTLVRGPAGLYDGTVVITSDLAVIEDYEAPLGVPVYYIVDIIDATTGAVESRTSSQATIPHQDRNWAWLKDPGNPQRNMLVMVQRAPDWQRPIEQSAYVVRGRRTKVVLSGRRQGLEGDLAIWTLSDDQRTSLHWLLDSGNVLLWQAAPGMGVSDTYVNVGQVGEERTDGTAMEQMRAWTLPLTEADIPVTTGVNGSAGRTWIDVLAEFATCSGLVATYDTCEDLLLDHRAR
ncbi:hypothetical protein OG298_45515 (plasmid) [Streptomyces sp. NBC_01005]|uniref:hypothetical protein n=1 Tax=Streptomyces sp. NBC_01005 TaxID=2903715 RepID=UPI002F90B100|nr:hypothetical protein OG298_45515 [Streptomyces sp. NBC_01005]